VVVLSGAYRTHASVEPAQETPLPEDDALHDVGQISLNQIERVRLAFSEDMLRTREGAAALGASPVFRSLLMEHVEDKQGMRNSLEEHEQIMQEETMGRCAVAHSSIVLMSEIQLRRIVDKLQGEQNQQKADGGEFMVKNGVAISKFPKEAMEIGAAVTGKFLNKVVGVSGANEGNDSVFPACNGAPKVLTKFKDKPYSYQLLPEYENGTKKLPSVKAMCWNGKSATATVIRGFTHATPVVERCGDPMPIPRPVIVPKFAPG
jgi:hypothetical protein